MDSELLLTDDAEAWLIDRRGIAKAQLAKVSKAGVVRLPESAGDKYELYLKLKDWYDDWVKTEGYRIILGMEI